MPRTTLFLLILLTTYSPSTSASESSNWVVFAESSDPGGDQAPRPAHYDLLSSRAETNGTWFAFTVFLDDASESNQRALYQLVMSTGTHQHTLRCFVGAYNPVQPAPMNCRGFRSDLTAPFGASTEAGDYPVLGSIDSNLHSLRLEIPGQSMLEAPGTSIDLLWWRTDVVVGLDVASAQVTGGRADEMKLEGSFVIPAPAATAPNGAPLENPPTGPRQTPLYAGIAAIGLLVGLAFRRRASQ